MARVSAEPCRTRSSNGTAIGWINPSCDRAHAVAIMRWACHRRKPSPPQSGSGLAKLTSLAEEPEEELPIMRFDAGEDRAIWFPELSHDIRFNEAARLALRANAAAGQ